VPCLHPLRPADAQPRPSNPRRTIEAVKERRGSSVDVAASTCASRRRAGIRAGSAPFHDDKSPPMTCHRQAVLLTCFSLWRQVCNAIKFLMEPPAPQLQLSAALLELARKYQLPVETLMGPSRSGLAPRSSIAEACCVRLALAAVVSQPVCAASAGAPPSLTLKEPAPMPQRKHP